MISRIDPSIRALLSRTWRQSLALWLALLHGVGSGILSPPSWVLPVLFVFHIGVLAATRLVTEARQDLALRAAWVVILLAVLLMPSSMDEATGSHRSMSISTYVLLLVVMFGWLSIFHFVERRVASFGRRQMRGGATPKACVRSAVDRALGDETVRMEAAFWERVNRGPRRPVAAGARACSVPARVSVVEATISCVPDDDPIPRPAITTPAPAKAKAKAKATNRAPAPAPAPVVKAKCPGPRPVLSKTSAPAPVVKAKCPRPALSKTSAPAPAPAPASVPSKPCPVCARASARAPAPRHRCNAAAIPVKARPLLPQESVHVAAEMQLRSGDMTDREWKNLPPASQRLLQQVAQLQGGFLTM